MRPAEGPLAAAPATGRYLRPGASNERVWRARLIVLPFVLAVIVASLPGALSAHAASIGSLRQRAAALAASIQTDYAKLGVLDEAYDQAETRVTALSAEVARATKAIGRSERTLGADRAHLRTVAIDAYVNGDSSPGLTLLFSASSRQLPMKQAYVNAASGDLATSEALVIDAANELAVRRNRLRSDDATAVATEHSIASERAQAQQISGQLQGELASVKGQISSFVARAEQERQLQERAARRAAATVPRVVHRSSAPAPQPQPQPQPRPRPAPAPSPGGGDGAAAVRAAESQLGVPYVWGGATPGVGFDCSGLTMWAWGQAGVSLEHGATAQYAEIAHVSMSDLRPGDLIFYGDASYLYHVVMYVGSGPYGADTVIQAEHTGTNVMFSPIPPGAFGAGQP